MLRFPAWCCCFVIDSIGIGTLGGVWVAFSLPQLLKAANLLQYCNVFRELRESNKLV